MSNNKRKCQYCHKVHKYMPFVEKQVTIETREGSFKIDYSKDLYNVFIKDKEGNTAIISLGSEIRRQERSYKE